MDGSKNILIFTTYYEDTVNIDTMFFQAKVAALVCLTADCVGLTEGYVIPGPPIKAKGSGFEADQVPHLLFGKGRDLFTYIHITVQ